MQKAGQSIDAARQGQSRSLRTLPAAAQLIG
jgi:hypothetical protein